MTHQMGSAMPPPSYDSAEAPGDCRILPVPSYTARPRLSEETLLISSRINALALPDGDFVTRTHQANIVLHNQDPTLPRPVYGDRPSFSGQIIMGQGKENVVSVDIQINGSLATLVFAGGHSDHLVQETHSLY
jgi:hypothetical protein